METEAKPWLSHYPKEISSELDYGKRPLFDYLKEAAEKHPNKVAIHFLGKELSYKQIYVDALKLAQQLSKLGLKKSDRVAIMLPNCPQSVIAYYATLMLGGIVVQTNPLYVERELEHQLGDSGAKMIICLDQLYPRVAHVKEQTKLEHIIVTGIQDYLPFPKNILYPFVSQTKLPKKREFRDLTHVHVFKALLKQGQLSISPVEISPEDDLALLQYTGGTTGPAKGVMLTHKNLIANTEQCRHWMYRHKYGEEVILGALPFFHVYGMTIVMNLGIMQLSKLVILPKFEAEEVLKTIATQKPTLFPGAPTMYIALINHPNVAAYDLSSIKTCVSGSAPLPIEVQQQFERLSGGKLVEGYGLTEASPVTHCNLIWGERVTGSIGLPYPDTEARILSLETGEEAGIKEIGELVVKGPQVMQGYWKRPDETEKVLKDGWLYTGDMGYVDERGYFYIVDRKKDMILASGFNIYPREVEEVLYEHPDVKEAAVIGVADRYRGETVKAFVVPKAGQTLSEEDLNRHCRKHLAAFKVPHIYEIRDELPKTSIGKILKRELIAEEQHRHLS
ncbi:long-chain-fatty-acid--CoA ligase [Pullulanibacillus camelliae]|uniref:Long-chain-fatty-acid--CoA ligase n=1 Tax=Pullulanibacillus camelliae TaxID=1707096 RepID=A0A8J2VXF2_9BACL|nr:AMP-binding protein [Pullulanibacillus camelliae]GGE42312.1 long-chain-fatty-acid--CoA ligase [Pullulanibacillus camelliae]